MEEERGDGKKERETLVGKDDFLGRGKIFFRSYYSPLRQKDCTQGGEPPVIFIVYVWLLLSLSTSNPRLEVIKIFTYPRGSSKFPFHPPFGSFFLSLSEYFSNIDTLYPFFQEQRPLEGDHHRMDSQRGASSSEDRPFIQASICIYVEATRAAQDERLFSIPGRPPADLFHTSSPCSFRNRDESFSFCKNRGIDGNFFFDFS